MNTDYTHAIFIIDESASMRPLQRDTIEGFNGLLLRQSVVPGKFTYSLYTFNEITRNRRLFSNAEAYRLTNDDYQPQGLTALNDAIIIACAQEGKLLTDLRSQLRPGIVQVYIITDGEENISSHSAEDAKIVIDEQTNTYSWRFAFIGANQDSALSGGKIGVAKGQSVNYRASRAGAASAYAATAENLEQNRISGGVMRSLTETLRGMSLKDMDSGDSTLDKK